MDVQEDIVGVQRARWTKYDELALLDKYLESRKNPTQATYKGLETKAWEELKSALNERLKVSLDKGNGAGERKGQLC
ncbi:hypothetical protein PHMEG_00019299 [Phytophthora megakarya]|uniref:Myb/SANT-like domain-containing protein n=1 Tax=Phytophthora megakarya TaxID=4795 RepID=A0A225VS79_9STRA|nr:hypothetical protein PHMEG_00019299 [Phytophthora megakarya]